MRDTQTGFADVGIDHWFRPLGVRLGGSYWGDPDILDSRDFNAGLYLRSDAGSLALNYEKRRFELDLVSDQLQTRTASFSADGWGASARLALGERVSLSVAGKRYDYSRNIRLQPDIDALRLLTVSRLSMIRSLVDDEVSAGIEVEFGLRSVDLAVERWQLALDGSTVDSLSVGFLTPLSSRTDLELRLGSDDSEVFGRTTVFSVYLYYFGGS